MPPRWLRPTAPRTAVIEAVIAHSDRSGFAHTRRVAPLITPLMRYAATRLWRDDLAYAERRYHVRTASSRRVISALSG